MSTINVDAETQARMVRMYVHEGGTLRSVAEATFWSQTQVRRVLLANGVQLRARGAASLMARGRQISNDEVLRRTSLYARGLSLQEVANVCGVTLTAVHNTLKREGVPRRTLDDAQRLAYERGRRVPAIDAMQAGRRAARATARETT